MLIDKYLARFHFREYHFKRINHQSENSYELMLHTDASNSPVIKLLFRLRGMPPGGRISEMEKLGFTKLEEKKGEEIVYGMISTTWIFGQCRHVTTPKEFIDDEDPKRIKAVINFRIDENGSGSTISTETRVLCGSRSMKKKFRIYWFVVQPFSRLIRKLMLNEIKRNITKQNHDIESGLKSR
jgi:hypothetical protein